MRNGLLEEFAERTVLVMGDVMLDEYLWGDIERISPEAPVPILEYWGRTHVVGGAANAAANIVSLSGHALLGGVVGKDHEAEILRTELAKRGVDANLVVSDDRPTTTKSRVIAGSQQVLRIDRENRTSVSEEAQLSLLTWAKKWISSIDGVLISDYGKGVVTSRLCQGLIELARAEAKTVVVDPKGRDYSKYAGATVVTPNVSELRFAVELLRFSSGELDDDVSTLRGILHGTSFLVTRGSEGVSLFRSDGSALHIPSREKSVFDVTGAGDTFAACLALALASGATLEAAATMANAAAGVVVGKVGTGTVTLSELDSEFGMD
jgi:rfaE bifunctional protein kinase chain/domain